MAAALAIATALAVAAALLLLLLLAAALTSAATAATHHCMCSRRSRSLWYVAHVSNLTRYFISSQNRFCGIPDMSGVLTAIP